MEEETITIGFEFVDRFGNTYQATSTFEPYANEVDMIGEQLNVFLKQAGYSRHNDVMLMEDLTEDERDELECYLNEIRKRDKCTIEESEACFMEGDKQDEYI